MLPPPTVLEVVEEESRSVVFERDEQPALSSAILEHHADGVTITVPPLGLRGFLVQPIFLINLVLIVALAAWIAVGSAPHGRACWIRRAVHVQGCDHALDARNLCDFGNGPCIQPSSQAIGERRRADGALDEFPLVVVPRVAKWRTRRSPRRQRARPDGCGAGVASVPRNPALWPSPIRSAPPALLA